MLSLAIVWDPPIGIDLGFYTIRFYSLTYLIAFVLGWYIMKGIFKNDKIPLEKLDTIFIYTVLATLIGARLGHVIFYQPELLKEDPLSVFLPFTFVPTFEFTGFQGLASHGAAIGIIIAMYIYSKKVLHKPLLWILDRVVVPTALGGMFIRIGNFMNSEIVGKPTGTDSGVIFVNYPEKVGLAAEAVPRYPAQLFEAGCYLLIFFALYYIYYKTKKAGQMGYIFGMFMILIWLARFVIEFLKEPQVEERASWFFNTGQLLSIPFVLIGVYFVVTSRNRPEPSN